MTYEWDEAKSRANLAKHAVSFDAIELFDWDNAVTRSSDRDGELRFTAIGHLAYTLFLVVYTIRGDNRRIISLRPASREEREVYGRLHRL